MADIEGIALLGASILGLGLATTLLNVTLYPTNRVSNTVRKIANNLRGFDQYTGHSELEKEI